MIQQIITEGVRYTSTELVSLPKSLLETSREVEELILTDLFTNSIHGSVISGVLAMTRAPESFDSPFVTMQHILDLHQMRSDFCNGTRWKQHDSVYNLNPEDHDVANILDLFRALPNPNKSLDQKINLKLMWISNVVNTIVYKPEQFELQAALTIASIPRIQLGVYIPRSTVQFGADLLHIVPDSENPTQPKILNIPLDNEAYPNGIELLNRTSRGRLIIRTPDREKEVKKYINNLLTQ